MAKKRLAVLLGSSAVLLVIGCGEVLGEGGPVDDASSPNDASAEAAPNDSASDGGDGAVADGPACDVNLLPYDKENCGACGRTCESASCNDGGCAPAEIVSNYTAVATKNAPVQIELLNGDLFIVDTNTNGGVAGVLRCAEPAATMKCAASRLFIRPEIQEIAFVDASVAYAAKADINFEGFDGGVGTFPLAGGVDASVKDDTVIDARSIARLGDVVLVATVEGIKRCTTSCKTLAAVAGTSAVFIVADNSGYCFSGELGGVRGVHCAPTVSDAPITRTTIGGSAPFPRIAIAGADVVWVDSGKIGSRKRAGSATETTMTLGGNVVNASSPVIADDAFVTWVHQAFLYRCARIGCTEPTILAETTPPQSFSSVAQHGKWLYFGESGLSSRVLRVPR